MKITKVVKKQVTLTGLTPIFFDRYPGDNKTQLSAEQKIYSVNGKLVLPVENIYSFLTAINTESAPKILFDPRKYRKICTALATSVHIEKEYVPFTSNGEDVSADFSNPQLGVAHHVARLDDGIPNPKERPFLRTPWELKFEMAILPHPDVNEDLIENIFTDGGRYLGLGTYRKRYGKFDFSWV